VVIVWRSHCWAWLVGRWQVDAAGCRRQAPQRLPSLLSRRKTEMMLPHSREYFVHVMIEVVDDDPQPRPDRFTRPGFYQVVGLRGPDAGFLFEPPD